MNYNPFVFVKSYQDRLNDFKSILSNNLKSADIKKEWVNYVELTIEPVGWQAIWNLSRKECKDLNLYFPCTVIVFVRQVNFEDLSCCVSITKVQDDNVQLTEVADVPLTELYPTLTQESSFSLSIYETAQVIDSLRFFYKHLWMPWDLEFDEDNFWVDSHLVGRLQLYFSILEMKCPIELAHKVRKLRNEGRKAQDEIEDIEELFEQSREQPSSKQLLQLTKLHHKLSHIGNQYSIYDNPVLLKALIDESVNQATCQELQSATSNVVLVLSTTTTEHLLRLVHVLKEFTSSKESISLISLLQDALVKVPMGGSVLVTQGEHHIKDLGNLEVGGTVKGVEEGAVLTDLAEGCSTLDLLKGSVTLTALTVHLTTAWNIIKVRPIAECYLSETRLQGSSVTDGIHVYSEAKLTAVNCHFTDCCTAIICDNNSTVTLSNCVFTNNRIAIQLKSGCNFRMENCSITGSTFFGVQISLDDCPLVQTGNLTMEYINSLPHMKESNTVCQDNKVNLHLLQTISN